MPFRALRKTSSLLALLALAKSCASEMMGFGGETAAVSSAAGARGPRQQTRQPIVTGSSVLGIKYKDGVMLAADTLASYGSLARYKDVRRIMPVGESTLVGASGEYSDFQAVMELLEEQHQDNLNIADGYQLTPAETFNYLRAVMYQRRNKFNPLWNYLLVAGFKNGKGFLGSVDHIGTSFEDDVMATGFGAYLAMPIIRKRWRADMEEGEARALLEDCLKVLFYRDTRALNRVQIAKATAEGVLISEPFTVETSWNLAAFAQPKAGMDTGGSW